MTRYWFEFEDTPYPEGRLHHDVRDVSEYIVADYVSYVGVVARKHISRKKQIEKLVFEHNHYEHTDAAITLQHSNEAVRYIVLQGLHSVLDPTVMVLEQTHMTTKDNQMH